MGHKMSQEHIDIYKGIDVILWNDWDPIGIHDDDLGRDEYYAYIPGVFRLKISGADIEAIANELNTIATERMGMPSNMARSRLVAEKILLL